MLLLLPFDRRIDWKRPPVVTLALIAINCLIYFGFQSDDEAITAKALRHYEESTLPEIEFPLYREYLRREKKFDELGQFETYIEFGEDGSVDYDEMQIPLILEFDYGFMSELRAGKLVTESHEKFQTWRQQRETFEELLNESFTHRYSLRPAIAEPVTFLSHMFMHGSFMHLLGNMVFLFIVGFVVETILGGKIYLLLYLLAGLAGVAYDVTMNSDNLIYHLGASGAVSGVMGAYAALFGLRRIWFFYNILFWFDRIKAPAILMLGLWLGNELLQQFSNIESNVNYMAHVTGLCAGALLTFVAKRFSRTVDLDYMDEPEKEQKRGETMEEGLRLMAELKPDAAKRVFAALLAETPDDVELLDRLYLASKFEPGSEDFHKYALRLLLHNDISPSHRYEVFEDYRKLAKPGPRLGPNAALQLAQKFLRKGAHVDAAEKLILAVLKRGPEHQNLPQSLFQLAKHSPRDKALIYYNALITRYPGSSEAETAKAIALAPHEIQGA